MADVFTDVAWANGNYVTEAKLDQMVANDRYNRDNADFSVLVNDSIIILDPSPSSPGTTVNLDLEFVVDTTIAHDEASYAQGTSWLAKSRKDIDISSGGLGVTTGLHDLKLRYDTPLDISTWRFVKTDAIEYLSIWWRSRYERQGGFVGGSTYSTQIEFQVSIIGHRTSQGW